MHIATHQYCHNAQQCKSMNPQAAVM